MQSTVTDAPRAPADGTIEHESSLQQLIEHTAHLLPSQGPIEVFVHHNTLHAFEHLDFESGVQAGGRLYGCHPYLPEERYRHKLQRGRIRVDDLDAVLQEDLGDEADRLVANFGTRHALRLAMLQFPLHTGPTHELRWVVAETDALRRFREEVTPDVRQQMIAETRASVLRHMGLRNTDRPLDEDSALTLVLRQFTTRSPETWSERTWEAFVLNYLWRLCCDGISRARNAAGSSHVATMSDENNEHRRHRDVLLDATGQDSDELVHDVLIRLCAACLDQGFADWNLARQGAGFFDSFLRLYGESVPAPDRWSAELRREARRLSGAQIGAIESIEESLQILGVGRSERQSFITQSLLALRGWAGMVWQMETNAEWAPHPASAGSLLEFLAVRLILERLALTQVARDSLGFRGSLDQIRERFTHRTAESERDRFDQRAFTIFQIAQVRGWKPSDLQRLSCQQWATLDGEIEAFHSLERRRIYHRAFERKYRNDTLDAVIAHSTRLRNQSRDNTISLSPRKRPEYQLVCCIDEREESFRRHLEEIRPDCETLGFAGFFGVAMYYRGAADAHFTPLCPVNVKPRHYVVEQPVYSAVEVERRRAEARRRIGQATHQTHLVTRSLFGGVLTGLLGSLAAIPLVARILFPRTTAQIRRLFGSIVRTHSTELRLERTDSEPSSDNGGIGYSVDEMADIVEGGLRGMGLATGELLARLVVICGHGSASLNNPHEAAHDCGACGGGRGGPNARAFAQMANDGRVRRLLDGRGHQIPDETYFVGGYHNTCDDSMMWYDLDRVPVSHRKLFECAKSDIDEARKRSSHERCRRFESAPLSLDIEEALRHVEGRSEDLSQTRPEYGHATNALCFVGRRDWSRGLFLDRRAFLTSYNPAQDDQRSSILEQLLRAVIPVCAGISLEYYFSYVDPTGYGCGTKLPHNITSLVGVMDGAASDLRPGLPWQMVEIHEPVRLLFVIEATPQAMQRIIDENEAIARLVNGEWVQLAVFDPATSHVHRLARGEFLPYAPHTREIPAVSSSIDWYRGQRDHLGFASIIAAGSRVVPNAGVNT